ncbi:MAG: hypothetical protein RR547_07815, partial [Raoultibacter sp.]
MNKKYKMYPSMALIDKVGALTEEAGDLADAICCVRAAALSPLDDSSDYINGTLSVLMRASATVLAQAEEILGEIETAHHGQRKRSNGRFS